MRVLKNTEEPVTPYIGFMYGGYRAVLVWDASDNGLIVTNEDGAQKARMLETTHNLLYPDILKMMNPQITQVLEFEDMEEQYVWFATGCTKENKK